MLRWYEGLLEHACLFLFLLSVTQGESTIGGTDGTIKLTSVDFFLRIWKLETVHK